MSVSVSWHSAHKLALSLPEAEERDHFGSPSFRVNGKIFAQLSAQQEKEQRALVRLSPADQAALTMSDSSTYSPALHWGHDGWTWVQLASIDESSLSDLFLQSWRNVAPKRLVVAHDDATTE